MVCAVTFHLAPASSQMRMLAKGVFSRFLAMSTLPLILNVLAEDQAAIELPVKSAPASLPVSNPTKSFWIDTPGANPLAKEGSDGALTHDADICIIGSGITGVSAAYHISRLLSEQGGDSGKDMKITILEARDFCKQCFADIISVHAILTNCRQAPELRV